MTGVKTTYVYCSLMGFSIKFSGMKAAVLHRMLISLTHECMHTHAHTLCHSACESSLCVNVSMRHQQG